MYYLNINFENMYVSTLPFQNKNIMIQTMMQIGTCLDFLALLRLKQWSNDTD